MCSIGEDDFGDAGGLHSMTKDEPLPDPSTNVGICAKCGANGSLIKLQFRDAECTNCFLAYARHKFRATLGSSKILPKGAEVLLLFDGSPESIVLLDMMHYSRSQDTHKRLHVNTKVLFVDESSLTSQVDTSQVKLFLSKYSFEAFIISLTDTDSLSKFEDLDAYLSSRHSDEAFAAHVNSIKTLTSRQDFHKIRKNQVVESAANQLKCGFVFASDISTGLATELLNSISLGRGGSAALDVSLLDDRLSNLKIIRPLRTLNASEVNFYLQVNNLEALKDESYGEALGANTSIQNLTKRFVADLQTNFSSTVSTVFRTGDKIAPNSSNELSSAASLGKCSLCKSSLDAESSNTLLAIEFSRLASALSGNLENCKEQILNNEHLNKYPNYCHACSNIKKDCANIDL